MEEPFREAFDKNFTSRSSYHRAFYYKFKRSFHIKHTQNAIFYAASKLKLYKKTKKKKPHAKRPYMKKHIITINSQNYKIKDGYVIFSIRPREPLKIKLASYVVEKLSKFKPAEITVTPSKLIFAYTKEVEEQVPEHCMGIDRNFDNATSCDTAGHVVMYRLEKANKVKAFYKNKRAKFKRNDVRIQKKISGKYGRKEKNKVNDIIYKTTTHLASQATRVFMEDIKGIRKLYRSGNGQENKFRGRMNSWSFYEFQRQLEYKSRWQGLPVKYVKAWGTSSKCAVCGSKLVPEEHRQMWCPKCRSLDDRDANASKNILARGIRDVPDGVASGTMKRNVNFLPIRRVDATQVNKR